MASISDVAKLAGVSKSTVSRVLNPGSSVSNQTRERVEKVIKELNFKPNNFAQGLKKNRSGMIGLVLVDISSPFYAALLGGVQSRIQDKQQELIPISSFGIQNKEIETINTLSAYQCDGLLVYLENALTPQLLQQLHPNLPPIVTLGQAEPLLSNNSVQVDHELGGYLAAKHLLENGHTRILFLAGLPRYPDASKRQRGFLRAMQEYDVNATDYRIQTGPFSEHFGYETTCELCQQGHNFTAICAGDDDIAAGVLLALRQFNIKVPAQISVIGYDDSFHAKHTFPALTTIRQPTFDLGETAMEQLQNMILMPSKIAKEILLKPELVIRDSVTNIK
ncbi:LacI family DNA-binding transcriptional regulator [Motilimonas pumila]|uniref:LacI family transcriptional regulator n=1 Tax=Motilimonas pumila TaxID=2303987 RepID=A0A418YH92_9GAMM|nr:LacI family DNA-binding transcriptional regulator [Motilimonas pumila]RJG49471.1 LacI family transcriptional regulator [Motilimonas pumila]